MTAEFNWDLGINLFIIPTPAQDRSRCPAHNSFISIVNK